MGGCQSLGRHGMVCCYINVDSKHSKKIKNLVHHAKENKQEKQQRPIMIIIITTTTTTTTKSPQLSAPRFVMFFFAWFNCGRQRHRSMSMRLKGSEKVLNYERRRKDGIGIGIGMYCRVGVCPRLSLVLWLRWTVGRGLFKKKFTALLSLLLEFVFRSEDKPRREECDSTSVIDPTCAHVTNSVVLPICTKYTTVGGIQSA